jgi:hypothetical protein
MLLKKEGIDSLAIKPYLNTLKELSDGSGTVQADGVIISIDNKFRDVFLKRMIDLEGIKIYDFLGSDLQKHLVQALKQGMAGAELMLDTPFGQKTLGFILWRKAKL